MCAITRRATAYARPRAANCRSAAAWVCPTSGGTGTWAAAVGVGDGASVAGCVAVGTSVGEGASALVAVSVGNAVGVAAAVAVGVVAAETPGTGVGALFLCRKISHRPVPS